MKNDSFLSIAMDLPEENASCNGNDDGKNEFTNGSSNNQGDAVEAKQRGNVNSSPSQWPLRHNNLNESLERHNSYSCNGFRQAKKPRYTYTGRISRIPSRYLDTDSDSGDGSVRKDGFNRLKVKRSRRRRKLPSSTNKLLANGFKEDALLLSVADFEVDAITENLGERECLANVEYSDVFENTSPISKYKISHSNQETQDKNNSRPNTSLGNEIICSEFGHDNAVSGKPIIEANSRSKPKQTVEHSFTSSGCYVDISCKNNSRPRFESLTESREETATEIHRVNEQKLENCSTRLSNLPCKCKNLHEASNGDDSSTRQTVVSPKQILKDCQVSCAIHNDIDTAASVERENYKNCEECGVDSSSIWSKNIQNGEDTEFELSGKITGDIGSKLLKKKRVVKSAKRSSKKLALKEKLKDSDASTLASEAGGFKCLKDFKMRKALATKLKQKQLRRNEKTDQNDILKRSKKNGVICNLKQKAKINAGKMERQRNKINRKVNKVSKMKDITKSSQHSEELDRVLGMRQSPNGIYEFLVEWQNGTSCWVSSDDVVMDKHNYYLREYLAENEQDVSVVNRVPFQAYCCDSLSLKECEPGLKSKKALRKMLCVETSAAKTVCKPVAVCAKQKDDVAVKYEEEYCYITLTRETCKRKNTCLKIMADLITALENAATSDCQAVVLRGLQSDVLCGLKLADMSKTGVEKENGILSQARYLVQTLRDYPKLLIALISKSAEGIGAVFLSLFDMICDEETWDKRQILDCCEEEGEEPNKVYTLPRVTGHSLLSEEILMGKHTENLEVGNPPSSDHDAFVNGASIVTSTLMGIEATLRLLDPKTSLLQVNGEISELFPATAPRFALFSDIKSGLSSEFEGSGIFNEVPEGSTVVTEDQSLSQGTIDENLIVDETNKDSMTDENLIAKDIASKSSSNTELSTDHLHIVTERHSNTDRSANDQVPSSPISMDHTITDYKKTEQVTTEQRTLDDTQNDDSTMKHIHHHNTIESATEYKNSDHTSTEENINVQTIADRRTDDEDNPDVRKVNCTTIIGVQSINDSVDQSMTSQENQNNEVLDTTAGDQNRVICTESEDTCSAAKNVVNCALDSLSNVSCGEYVESFIGTDIEEGTDSIVRPEYITSNLAKINNSGTEIQLNHVHYVRNDCNLTQISSPESTITQCPTLKDTGLIEDSTESMSNDVVMEIIENTDKADNRARSNSSETATDECRDVTNIDKVIVRHDITDHICSENTDNTSKSTEYDTSKQFISDENTGDKNDISFAICDLRSDITTTINEAVGGLKQNVNDVTGDEKTDRDFAWRRETENEANVNNSISEKKNLMIQNKRSGYDCFNSTEFEHSTGSTEKLEEIKTSEVKFTTLNPNTSNETKLILTNDIDMNYTNCPSTMGRAIDKHIEIIGYEGSDSIPENAAEHTRTNDNEIFPSVSSTTAAVDRYVKKLEAQIEAEKSQAQQYIEEISRLWDCPFLNKNKK